MSQFREVLFKRNFFSLWSGQIVSEFGDRLSQMALIALVYSKQPGSAMAMAKLLFFIVVPVFVIGPVAGVYVDRWNRKKVMVISDIIRGLSVVTIPIFVQLDMMPIVYCLVFITFSAARFFIPSKLAIIPALVSEDKLLIANSLSNTTRVIATILGFALAGFIVQLIGYKWGFYLDSLSYFISAALVGSITIKKKEENIIKDEPSTKELIDKTIRKHVFAEIIEGFKHMITKDKMRVVTSSLFLMMAGVGSIFCIMIVFVQESFGSVTKTLGVFGVFIGVGLFVGTILFGRYGHNVSKIKTMFVSFVSCGVFISAFAFYSSIYSNFMIGGLLILLVGATAAPILTCSNTLVHILIPDEIRGRIFSSLEAVMHLGFIIFMFLTAYAAKYTSNVSIILFCGGLFVISGTIGLIIVRKEKE
jgi:MFS family permease